MAKTNRRVIVGALVAFAIFTSNAVPGMAGSPGKPAIPAAWVSKDADPQCPFNDEKNSTQQKSRWCLAGLCRSGDPTPRKICYNFTTGKITSSNLEGPAAPIAPNTPITVEVTGVNFYRMSGKITIQQDTFSDNTRIPDIIAQNVLGSAKASTAEASDAKTLTSDSAGAKKKAALQQLKELVDRKRKETEASAKKIKNKKTQSTNADDKSNLQKISTEATVAADVQESAHQVLAIAKSNNESVSKALEQYGKNLQNSSNASTNFGKALADFNNATEELDDIENLPLSVQKLAFSIDNPAMLRDECQAIVATALRMPEKVITPQQLPNLRATANRAAEDDFVKVKEAYSAIDPNDKDSASLFKKASKRSDDLAQSRTKRDNDFGTFLALFSKIQDPTFGKNTSLPVASTGDDVEIRFDDCLTSGAAQASGAGTCDSSKATTILVIPIVGQRQPSFSTGIFFTGLDDPSYFKAQNGKIQANAEDRFSPVLGALIHTPLIFFGGPNLSAPLSFGIALKDNNPVYLLGLSFIIGRKERSVLTLGMAGGQVTRLSGAELVPVLGPASRCREGI
jgi:hypothetical protein